jgi:hypothetical protein
LAFAADMGVEFIQLDKTAVPPTDKFDMVMLHSVLQHLHDSRLSRNRHRPRFHPAAVSRRPASR